MCNWRRFLLIKHRSTMGTIFMELNILISIHPNCQVCQKEGTRMNITGLNIVADSCIGHREKAVMWTVFIMQ